METAIEAEAAQIPIDAQKRFLVNVLGFFRRPEQVDRQTQNRLIVLADQLFKRPLVAALRGPNQSGLAQHRLIDSYDRVGHRHS